MGAVFGKQRSSAGDTVSRNSKEIRGECREDIHYRTKERFDKRNHGKKKGNNKVFYSSCWG